MTSKKSLYWSSVFYLGEFSDKSVITTSCTRVLTNKTRFANTMPFSIILS